MAAQVECNNGMVLLKVGCQPIPDVGIIGESVQQQAATGGFRIGPEQVVQADSVISEEEMAFRVGSSGLTLHD